MKTTFIIIAAVIVILGILIFYGVNHPDKVADLVGPDIRNVSFTKGTDETDRLSVIFRNGIVPVSLDSVFIDVSLEDNSIVKIAKHDSTKVPSGAVDTLSFPAKIDYMEIMNILQNARKQDRDSLQLKISGSVFYHFPLIGDTKIPVDKQFSFKTPTPPEISLEQIQIQHIDMPEINLMVTVKIKNNEPTDLEINSLHYSFLLGDSIVVSKGSKDNRIMIKGNESTTTDIPVTVKTNTLDNVFFTLIKKGGDLPVALNSQLNISTNFETLENLTLEIHVEDTVEIIK